MRRLFMLGLISYGCSSSPQPIPHVDLVLKAPPDESHRFAEAGQVKMEMIQTHLLDKAFMPGGNLATYHTAAANYQQFLGKTADAQAASFLLLDWKKELKDAKYLPQFGGYFGMNGDRPLFVFVKGPWVAGVVGLNEAKADAVAREFARHL